MTVFEYLLIEHQRKEKNMNIADLLNELHGTANPKVFRSWPDKVEAKKTADYLGVDPKYLRYNPTGFYQYVYWDGLFYYPFTIWKRNELEAFYESGMFSNHKTNFPEQFRRNIAHFKEVRDNKEFVHLFGMVDKKFLFHVFNTLYNEIPADQKWDAYKEAHIRAETGFDVVNPQYMKQLLTKYAFLSPERDKRLKELKKAVKGAKKFIVYHGANEKYDPKDDISWTISKETAEWFANRYDNQNSKVFSKEVRMDDVLDYFSDRNEDEVILKLK